LRKPIGLNVGAALFTGALAVVALAGSYGLELGTVQEIGPGFFPVILAVILLALCAALFLVSIWGAPEQDEFGLPVRSRSLVGIIGALALFALTMRGTDLGPVHFPALGVTGATPLAILTAGLAARETHWPQLLALAVVLTAGCTALFRYMLGLPLPVAPWIIGY
jgi:Tripartite tricarboxylate transporter TctB family